MARIDDGDLANDRILLRRIIPLWITREDDGTYRPQSFAFIDGYTNETSVFVADLIEPSDLMRNYPSDSLVGFAAAIPRSEGCIVAKTPENPDPSHRVIVHATKSGMKRAGKLISRNFHWVVFRAPPK